MVCGLVEAFYMQKMFHEYFFQQQVKDCTMMVEKAVEIPNFIIGHLEQKNGPFTSITTLI